MEITRIRLAILSILIVLIQQCSGESQKKIVWGTCNNIGSGTNTAETICHISRTCKFQGTPNQIFDALIDTNELLDKTDGGKCDTGFQVKPYSRTKWLVYMQVIKDDAPLDPKEGVWLEGANDGKKYFGCKKTTTSVEFDSAADLKIEEYTKAEQEISADRIFCSFVISGTEYFDTSFKDGNRDVILKYKTSEVKPRSFGTSLETMAAQAKHMIRCDPDDAKYNDAYHDPVYVTQSILITEPKNNVCPAGQHLFVKESSASKYVETNDIECIQDGPDYKFSYTPKGGAQMKIQKGTSFHVHCAFKACFQCTKPSEEGKPNDAPPFVFTPADPAIDKCATVTCGNDGDIWKNNWGYETEDGMTGVMMTTLDCKKNGAGNASWFMQGGKVEVKKAWCSKEIDCATKNPLNLTCPPKSEKFCRPPNINSKDYGCKDKLRALILKTDIDMKSLICDNETGRWWGNELKTEAVAGTYIYCPLDSSEPIVSGAKMELYVGAAIGGSILIAVLIGLAAWGYIEYRRHRRYSPSERLQRQRPRAKWYHKLMPEKLITDDLSQFKEWTDDQFDVILQQWLKFSIYERYKFAERVGFELGVNSTAVQYFKLFNRVFEVELDYRVWQSLVPVFKLLHAQVAEKENNLDTDKRMRKWCISLCKPIVEKVGWEGCNNEWREQAYQRYIIFNMMYYCEDKEFTEKLLEFFDKGQFHNLHSINRQIAWAAAVRDKDQFEAAKLVAEVAVCDKNARREIAAKRAAAAAASGGKTKSGASDASGKSTKSNKGSAKDKKVVKAGSKEAKSVGSKESKSKSVKSNRSNKSGKSKEGKEKEKEKGSAEKKGSKETPSGKGKKGDSKEAKSDKSGKSGKDKKDKGASKEGSKKGKSREKAGADDVKDSGKEKKEPPSDKDKKKDKSGKDKKDKSGKSSKDKKTTSGKDKKDKSGKDKKDKSGKSSKDKKTTSGKDKKTTSGKDKKDKSGKSSKDKKTTSGKEKKTETASGKEKKDKSGKEKTCPSNKSTKSSKDKKKGDKSSKSSKEAKTAVDKTATSAKSMKSKKSTMTKKKPTKIGYKERKDADGDKLHGDRAQHIFFAIGSSRNKEQIASFLDYYIESKEYDPSNLVYLFAATLEWDDTRSYGLDLFLNMNKKAFIKMPPGDKYHMRILKNFRKYVIGELDLQKMQDHIIHDPNYTVAHYAKIELSLMLKRIHNNITFQPKMIEELDEALKKLGF